jgi:hypothetical protein
LTITTNEAYSIDLPQACPIDGAKNVENLEVFRVVKNSVPTDIDFVPIGVKKRKYFTGLGEELLCQSLGLSIFSDLQDAEIAKLFLSEKYSDIHFIAKGVLTSTCGKVKETPSRTGESHKSWWTYLGVTPHTFFNVI